MNRLAVLLVLATTSAGALFAGALEDAQGVPRLVPVAGPSAPSLVTNDRAEFRSIIRCIERWRGDLWWGTYGDGLFRRDASGAVTRYTTATAPLLDDRVNTLAAVGAELWAGTCRGINRFDGAAWTAVTSGPGSVAGNIYHCTRVGPEGGVWVGTTGQGLSLWKDGAWTTFTERDGLNSSWVNEVAFVDGAVWVATYNGVSVRPAGEARFRNATPKAYPLHRNTVGLGWIPARQELWIGSSEGGVYGFQDGVWFHPPVVGSLPSPAVYCMAVDGSGKLWVGTDKGVTRYELDEGWRTFGAAEGLQDPYTKTLYWDAVEQTLWAGSFSGVLARLEGDRWHTVVERSGGGR